MQSPPFAPSVPGSKSLEWLGGPLSEEDVGSLFEQYHQYWNSLSTTEGASPSGSPRMEHEVLPAPAEGTQVL